MKRADVVYRCPICGQTYSPDQAVEIGFYCHDTLDRVVEAAPRTLGFLPRRGADDVVQVSSYTTIEPPVGQVTLQVIPPASNEVDPTVVEQILGSITQGPLSLELAGDSKGQYIFLRGLQHIVRHAQFQLQAGYGQVAFRPLPTEEDPVYADGDRVATACCTLRRPVYFPLRTWRQFGGTNDLSQVGYQGQGTVKMADPMRVLVGALDDLGEKERALIQLVLVRRAPEDWADAYQGSAQEVDFRVKAASPAGQARGALLMGAMLLVFLDLIFLCNAASAIARYGLLSGRALAPLGLAVLLTMVSALIGYGAATAWRRLTTILLANPQVIRQKVSQPAFHAQLRFWAWAPDEGRAREILDRLLSAYAIFDLAEGNALVPRSACSAHPALLSEAGNNNTTMLLNLTEIAGLWHMPMGELPERMGRQMFFRRAPQEITRPEPGSVEIGRSTKGDEPVYLSQGAVQAGIFLIGKPQVGKSTLMEELAAKAMEDPNRAVIVIDPHQDMVRRLMARVPPERLSDVRCLDMAGTVYPGINLLDMTVGASIDKVVSDLVVVGQSWWSEYWGPRMEQVLRYAARTIALINRRRVAEGHPERQLSILFIPRLLLARGDRRNAYLIGNLPTDDTFDVADVLWWWGNYYDRTGEHLLQQVISPVITKIYHISNATALRNTFGQPQTTLNFREVIRNRGIVLVNTGGALLGQDVGAFVGSLVINHVDTVVREQGKKPRDQRVPMTVVVDEFQTISGGVSWRDFLGQLRKFGVHVVLGTQSLAGLRQDNREMPGEILAGVMTVVAFQINAEDAQYLQYELDQSVPPASMTNLPPYHAYVKTVGQNRQRLPVLEVHLNPPPEVDPATLAMVQRMMHGYAVSADQADALLRQAEEELVDHFNATLARDTALRQRLALGEQVVSPEELLVAARAMGTRSTQNYAPQSGGIGRGQSTRRGRRRPGVVGGYQVATEGEA